MSSCEVTRTSPCPNFPKIHPDLYGRNSVSTQMPIHLSQGANTIYISNIDVGCSQWGFAALTA